MTDLSFDAADITAAIQKNLEGFDPSVESGTVGRILEVGDGIARVSGLPNASVNEILEFESCLLYTSPSPRDGLLSRMPSSA